MSDYPFFSVVIPVHGRADMLRGAMGSVLAQGFRDFELIVVDDGSEVSAAEEIAAECEGRAKLLRNERCRGVSHARNRGIANAAGEWLLFLDSDDEWMPGKLSKHFEYIQDNPENRIHQTLDRWFRNGREVFPGFKHRKRAGDLFEESLKQCVVAASSAAIRRSLFETVGNFDENLNACEDYDLWLRIGLFHPVGLIREKLLLRYAGHPDQLSFKYPAMDRFRLYSMVKLYQTCAVGGAKREALLAESSAKAKILLDGALKRGKKPGEEATGSLLSIRERKPGEVDLTAFGKWALNHRNFV